MNLFLILAAVAIVVLILSRSMSRRGDVSGAEARALVEGGARLLDVRTASEFAAGHLPGAVNIPLHELGTRARELGRKDGGIVVYCLSGHRSQRARGILVASGFTAVHDLGAMRHW